VFCFALGGEAWRLCSGPYFLRYLHFPFSPGIVHALVVGCFQRPFFITSISGVECWDFVCWLNLLFFFLLRTELFSGWLRCCYSKAKAKHKKLTQSRWMDGVLVAAWLGDSIVFVLWTDMDGHSFGWVLVYGLGCWSFVIRKGHMGNMDGLVMEFFCGEMRCKNGGLFSEGCDDRERT